MDSVTLTVKQVRGSVWNVNGANGDQLFSIAHSTTRGSTGVMLRTHLPCDLINSVDKGSYDASLDAALAECGKALATWMKTALGLTIQVAVVRAD